MKRFGSRPSVAAAGAGVLSLLTWLQRPAMACSMCYFGHGRDDAAYTGTMFFLMACVVALLGGLVFWLIRAARLKREG